MIKDLLLLITYLACSIMCGLCAYTGKRANDKIPTILFTASSVLYGLCTVLQIIEMMR